jgi:hypothetical protein
MFAPRGGGPNRPSSEEIQDAQLTARLARERTAVRAPATGGRRPAWRAVVRISDRDNVRTEWHLAACSDPDSPTAHCSDGQRLLQTMGEPAGHCLVDGCCGLCGVPAE